VVNNLYVGGLVVLFGNFYYQTYLSPKAMVVAMERAKKKRAEGEAKKES
jgi:hypothetical protein